MWIDGKNIFFDSTTDEFWTFSSQISGIVVGPSSLDAMRTVSAVQFTRIHNSTLYIPFAAQRRRQQSSNISKFSSFVNHISHISVSIAYSHMVLSYGLHDQLRLQDYKKCNKIALRLVNKSHPFFWCVTDVAWLHKANIFGVEQITFNKVKFD